MRRTYKQAVRWGEWKGVRNGARAPIELYDLGTDPGETRNLAEAEHERTTELFARLRTWMDDTGAGREVPRMELSEDDIEGLRALGYVE